MTQTAAPTDTCVIVMTGATSGIGAEALKRLIAQPATEIIVGARGLGRVRALLGSVSHELLHIADRPVLVIPTAAVETVRREQPTQA